MASKPVHRSESERFQRIIDRIYGVTIGEVSWSEVLEDVRVSTNASSGVIFQPLVPPHLGGLWEVRGIDPASISDYGAYYHEHDIWNDAVETLGIASCAVFDGEALVERAILEKSEWYNDFLQPYGISSLCGTILRGDQRSYARTHVSLYRAPGADNFARGDLRLMQQIVRHIDRALEIQSRLDIPRALNFDYRAALNQVNAAILLVDRSGCVVFANAAAERLLELGDGLTYSMGRLATSRADENTKLHRLIMQAAATPIPSDGDSVLAVSRPSGRRSWTILVSPLPMERSDADQYQRPAAILFVASSAQPNEFTARLLGRLFDLTPVEARLATELGFGRPLLQAADRLHMSPNTARWHLKHVFEKMDVHHQTELVALVASLPMVKRARSREP